jgi:glycosyltransferase involved in cell wall biosynthesis
MTPGKGQRYLLDAFTRYRRQGGTGTLVIVGYGPLKHRLKKAAEKYPITGSVLFAGQQTELAPWYLFADAYVSSSIDEGMGVVIYDAMAAGLPVAAFDAGSIGEIVADGIHGILAENKNAAALADAMHHIAGNASERQRMGAVGSALIFERYQSSGMATAYLTWYKELFARKNDVSIAL